MSKPVQEATLEREDALARGFQLIDEIRELLGGSRPKTEPRALGGPGSGHFGHAGRPGHVGGSGPGGDSWSDDAATEEEHRMVIADWKERYHARTNYDPPDTSSHPMIRTDQGHWGASHGTSQAMAKHAAGIMGIPGWEKGFELDEEGASARGVNDFLSAIVSDKTGAEEMLYHGFQNYGGTVFEKGDTFKTSLLATSGQLEGSAGYGMRSDRIDQAGEPTVLAFQKGTPMVAYNKSNTEYAKEFGYVYNEALIAGEFEVVNVETKRIYSAQHDTRPGRTWQPTTRVRVVTVKPKSVYDPTKKEWVSRG